MLATILCFGTQSIALTFHGDQTGTFAPKMRGDTLVIKYSLQFRFSFRVFDSVTFHTIPQQNDLHAEAATRATAKRMEPSCFEKCDTTKGQEWAGRIYLAGYENGIPDRFVLSYFVTAEDSITSEERFRSDTLAFRDAGGMARYANMGISFASRKDFPDGVKSDIYLPTWRLEDRLGLLNRHSSFWVGYSINHSRTFSLYDYAKLE